MIPESKHSCLYLYVPEYQHGNTEYIFFIWLLNTWLFFEQLISYMVARLVCNWYAYFNTVVWMINYTLIWDFPRWQTSIKMNLESQSVRKSFLRTPCVCCPTTFHNIESSAQKKKDSCRCKPGWHQAGIWLLYACVCLLNIFNINFGSWSKAVCESVEKVPCNYHLKIIRQ